MVSNYTVQFYKRSPRKQSRLPQKSAERGSLSFDQSLRYPMTHMKASPFSDLLCDEHTVFFVLSKHRIGLLGWGDKDLGD